MAPTVRAAADTADRLRLGPVVAAFLRRFLIQIGPVLVFFAVFAWDGIVTGTAAFVAAALVSVTITAVRHRSVPTMTLVSAGLVACFGALTLVFGEAAYIQMQPTVANGLYAAVLGGGRLAGHDLLRRSFSPALRLDAEGWRILTWRLVAHLAALAVANELVRRGFSTGTWITFKALVVAGLDLGFAAAQIPLLRAHWTADSADGR